MGRKRKLSSSSCPSAVPVVMDANSPSRKIPKAEDESLPVVPVVMDANSPSRTIPKAEDESLPVQSSPPVKVKKEEPISCDQSHPPEDNGPTPRYCRIPCPKDLTEEELKSKSEKHEELQNKSYSEWDLKDLLSFRCSEYRRNKISEAQGLKEMEVTRNYYKQLEESQGFDIDFEPKYGVPPGYGHIYPLRCAPRLLKTKYKRLANSAIKSYNEDHQTRKFEVVEVLKVNITETMDPFYYITFTANDVLSRYRCKTFQAHVCVPFIYNGYKKVNGKPVIICCRLKPRN